MNYKEKMVSRESSLLAYVRLVRPKQWIKNIFVLAPLLFSGLIADLHAVYQSLFALSLFCIGASAVYIVNDIKDLEEDRRHPIKSASRPLAAGWVSVSAAIKVLLVLYAVVLSSYLFSPKLFAVLAGYIGVNYLYSIYLKKYPVIDIFTISIGFVLRVYAGAVVLEVPVSSWMFVTTFSLSLFLAAIKRRQELVRSGAQARDVLRFYSIPLAEKFAEIAATGCLIFYSLFVVTERPELVLTIPLVLYGLFRYWYLVDQHQRGESPTDVLWSDWQLAITVVLWSALSVAMISKI